ncbi:Protochlorophyllide-dependent translocon component 52, chloroplastic [Linum perenne]
MGKSKLVQNHSEPFHGCPLQKLALSTAIILSMVKREGGTPVEMKLEKFGINGFDTARFGGESKFIAPCVYYSSVSVTAFRELSRKEGDGSASAVPKVKDSSAQAPEKRVLLVFFCIPVGPGKSRLIFAFPRNFAVWADKLIPRWICHVGQNLVLDSDLYWSHVVNCSSCNGAYKALKAVEVALQIVAVALIAIVAATAKQ